MMRSHSLTIAILAAAALAHRAAAAGYSVVARYPIGGTGSYDYIRFDPASRRLFASHENRVEVLDADSGRPVGAITGLRGSHGIAIAGTIGRGFISNGKDGTVTEFDLKSLAVLGSIRTGGLKPDAIEFDPDTGLVAVSNGHSNTLSLIDAASGQVRHLVALPGNPESIAFDGRGDAFVNLESASEIAKIDLAAGTVQAVWPLAPGEGPTGLAIDRAHHRLFATCGGNETMVVLDADTGRKLATLPIGDDSDGAAFDPATQQAYSSNRDGTLTIVAEESPDRFSVVTNVATQRGARTLAVDAARNRIYLPVVKFGPAAAPTAAAPEPKATILPGSFEILVVGQS